MVACAASPNNDPQKEGSRDLQVAALRIMFFWGVPDFE
jgi:hypothetical protein